MTITKRNTVKKENFTNKKHLLTYKKGLLPYKQDLLTYTKKDSLTNTKNPRQIPTTNSWGKILRQILAANSHGKFLPRIPTANSRGKYLTNPSTFAGPLPPKKLNWRSKI